MLYLNKQLKSFSIYGIYKTKFPGGCVLKRSRCKMLFFNIFFIAFFLWNFYSSAQEGIPILKKVGLMEQYKKTMLDMALLSDGISGYIEHMNKAPEADSLKELLQEDCGNGLTIAEFLFDQMPVEKIPLKDIWNNDFLYKYQGKKFWIASSGSDGEFQGFDQSGFFPFVESILKGKDLILLNKDFVLSPLDEKQISYISLIFRLFFVNSL